MKLTKQAKQNIDIMLKNFLEAEKTAKAYDGDSEIARITDMAMSSALFALNSTCDLFRIFGAKVIEYAHDIGDPYGSEDAVFQGWLAVARLDVKEFEDMFSKKLNRY